jgi:RNA recognition motif-containing protein
MNSSTNGWPAWRNAKKENDELKKQLQEKPNIYETSQEEKEILVTIVQKLKVQTKELILNSNNKKQEFNEKIKKLNEEYKTFELENEEKINSIMQKIEVYSDIINSKKENLATINNKETQETNKSEVFVGSLPAFFKDIDLYNLFKKYGQVNRARVLTTKNEQNTVVSKCCGFVQFDNNETALKSIKELNGTLPNGFKFPILIEFSKCERKKDDQDRYNMFNIK